MRDTKEYFGNYLGLCINNDDPEKRGRVQVFIPHIMPALYEEWNEAEADIQLICVGDNLPTSLTSKMVEKLKLILPWAEAASPVVGQSAPGNLIGADYNTSPVPTGIGPAGPTGTSSSPGFVPSYINNGTLPYDRTYEVPGNGPLNSDNLSIILHDSHDNSGSAPSWLTNGEIGGTPGKGTYNYVVFGGKAWSTTTEGTASYYGTRGQNSSVINVAWIGKVGSTPNAADQSALNNLISYLASKYNIPTDRIKTHGAVQSDKSPNEASWAPTALASLNNAGSSYDRTQLGGGGVAAAKAAQDVENDPNSPLYSSALLPYVNSTPGRAGIITGSSGQSLTTRFTAYSPQAPGSSSIGLEGGYASARPGLDGQSVVRTLQDVANGSSNYVTLAGDPSTYGSQYTIPSITFTNSAGQTQTLNNVTGYVHDTGSAFVGAGTSKFDIAVDRDLPSSVINSQPFLANNGSITLGPLAANPNSAPPTGYSPFTIQNPHPAVGPLNMNNMASGMFSYPNPNALLWVFFREGNPRFPVYFAASYGQKEWQSVYKYNVNSDGTAQDTFGYKPVPTPDDGTISNSVTMKLGPAGALTSNYTVDPNNPLNDQAHTALHGPDGAMYNMGLGVTTIHNPFDEQKTTTGDLFETIGGQYNLLCQGGLSIYCLGDCVITCGSHTQTALDAANDINKEVGQTVKKLAEVKKPPLEGPGCSAPTEDTSPAIPPTIQSVNREFTPVDTRFTDEEWEDISPTLLSGFGTALKQSIDNNDPDGVLSKINAFTNFVNSRAPAGTTVSSSYDPATKQINFNIQRNTPYQPSPQPSPQPTPQSTPTNPQSTPRGIYRGDQPGDMIS
jgi:hypothetical protein